MNKSVVFPKLYKISEVAEKLRVSPKTILRWIEENKYIDRTQVIKVKNTYVVTEAETERLVSLFINIKQKVTKKGIEVTYFIQAEDLGYIKIGKAVNPKKRLKELQVAMPVTLILLAVDMEIPEKAYHKKFAKDKKRGEWFHPTIEILKHIELLKVKSPVK